MFLKNNEAPKYRNKILYTIDSGINADVYIEKNHFRIQQGKYQQGGHCFKPLQLPLNSHLAYMETMLLHTHTFWILLKL